MNNGPHQEQAGPASARQLSALLALVEEVQHRQPQGFRRLGPVVPVSTAARGWHRQLDFPQAGMKHARVGLPAGFRVRSASVSCRFFLPGGHILTTLGM